jgi:hypothetical protein
MLAVALFLCIPFFHEPMIRRIIVMSDGKRMVELVGGISKALMLTGCMILIGLRVMIPLFDLTAAVPFRGQDRVPRRGFMMMDW